MLQPVEERQSEPRGILEPSNCFACGGANARGLGLRFQECEGGAMARNGHLSRISKGTVGSFMAAL